MPKLFDEFDLDLQKVNRINPLSDSGGDSVAQCSGGGGTDYGSSLCPIPGYTLEDDDCFFTHTCFETWFCED